MPQLLLFACLSCHQRGMQVHSEIGHGCDTNYWLQLSKLTLMEHVPLTGTVVMSLSL